MSTEQDTNKAIVRRFHDAANTGDVELLSSTIDELVEPDATIRTPLPVSFSVTAFRLVSTKLKSGASSPGFNSGPTNVMGLPRSVVAPGLSILLLQSDFSVLPSAPAFRP